MPDDHDAMAIAVLRTLCARLTQDNDRLIRENEQLRASLAQTSARETTRTRAQAPAIDRGEGSDARDVLATLAGIAQESAANAQIASLGSIAGGQLRSVGFAEASGYLQAIRRGVPPGTHAVYLQILRTRYRVPEAEIAALPGPMARLALPVGPGITHVPSGVPLFDRPRSDRGFLVGAAAAAQASPGAPVRGGQTTTPARRPGAPPRSPQQRILAGSVPVKRPPAPPPSPAPAPPRAPSGALTAPSTPSIPDPNPLAPPRPRSGPEAQSEPGQGDDAAARFALLELD